MPKQKDYEGPGDWRTKATAARDQALRQAGLTGWEFLGPPTPKKDQTTPEKKKAKPE